MGIRTNGRPDGELNEMRMELINGVLYQLNLIKFGISQINSVSSLMDLFRSGHCFERISINNTMSAINNITSANRYDADRLLDGY